MTIDASLKRIIVLQTVMAAVVVGVFAAIDRQIYAASTAAVSGILVLNWLALWLSWGALLFKKSIALGIGLIVTKYALLGLLVFWLADRNWFAAESWAVALLILLLALLIEALFFRRKGN